MVEDELYRHIISDESLSLTLQHKRNPIVSFDLSLRFRTDLQIFCMWQPPPCSLPKLNSQRGKKVIWGIRMVKHKHMKVSNQRFTSRSYWWPVFIMLSVFFFFFFFRAPVAYGSFQTRGIKSETQLQAYTTVIAARDQSCICDLHHSSQQHQILNPQSDARDGTCILMDTSWIHFCWATMLTPFQILFTFPYRLFSCFSLYQMYHGKTGMKSKKVLL